MKYRQLGSTNIKVSEIGFGGWGIGGNNSDFPSYGPTDDTVSLNALRKAKDLGVNFFDTSNQYGGGHSEKLIGEAFHKDRDEIVIASKVGWTGHKNEDVYSPETLRRSLEESLRRLRTDYIDLYQLHSPDVSRIFTNGKVIKAFNRFIKEGKVRAVGISVKSPDDAIKAIKNIGFESVMVNFNMMDIRALKSGLFQQAKESNVGIIVRTPLCFGFLTGQYNENTKYQRGDHRARWSKDQMKKWSNGLLTFDSIEQEKGEQTHAQYALRFCLSFNEVSTVIPGMLSEKHVLENCQSSDLGKLPSSLVKKIIKTNEVQSFFLGNK